MNRSNHNFIDELLFNYLEGNLNPHEEKLLQERLIKDPNLNNQLELWQSAFVKEQRPVFYNKANLYRKPGGWYTGRILAGFSVLLVITGLWYFLPDTEPEVSGKPNSQLSQYELHPEQKVNESSTDNADAYLLISKEDELKASVKEPEFLKIGAEKELNEIDPERKDDQVSIVEVEPEITDSVENVDKPNIKQEAQQPESSSEKPDSIKSSKTKIARDKKQLRKKRRLRRRSRRRIRWEDVKRAWYNETTVVPME